MIDGTIQKKSQGEIISLSSKKGKIQLITKEETVDKIRAKKFLKNSRLFC